MTTAAQQGTGSSGDGKAAEGPSKKSGDTSIQEYGASAKGAGRAAVTAAAHGFFTAMADGDYAGMCADLAAVNVDQLKAFGEGQGRSGGCPSALKGLLDRNVAAEARAAAAAPVTSVRVKGDTAFALFKPRGGSTSYFTMKREGGGWKAISVTPGTPLDPSANP